MTSLISPVFLFRYSLPVMPLAGRRSARGALTAAHRLPRLNALAEAAGFGEVSLGWHTDGLLLRAAVRGRKLPVSLNAANPAASDGVQVWIDTRNADVHRATRFCHSFILLPGGGGESGAEPIAVSAPIAQAREPQKPAAPGEIPVTAKSRTDGYEIEAWFPTRVLHGYDPGNHRRLGFFYLIRDTELGEQTLTVGAEFPYAIDPSMWVTLELT